MSDLLDQLDAPMAEAWIGQEGDKIVGTVIGVSSRDGGYGEYPIAVLNVKAGTTVDGVAVPLPAELAVHLMATVLMNEVGWDSEARKWTQERKLFIGSTLAIKDQGKKKGGNGNEYHAYRVIVEPPKSAAEQLDDEPDGLF